MFRVVAKNTEGRIVADKTFASRDKAEEVAEAARYAHDLHTIVTDSDGEIVAEFEI